GGSRSRPRDRELTILERLAQRFDSAAAEFGELVEKEYAVVRERHLSGARRIASADEPRLAHRMVRAAGRPPAPSPGRAPQAPRHAIKHARRKSFFERRGRKDRRQAPSEHRLAAAWRADEQEVVTACGADLERTTRTGLPAHVGQIEPRRVGVLEGR